MSDPLNKTSKPAYRTALGTLTTIVREEGITGLWKGNVPAEALYLAYGSVQFLSYRSATQALDALPEPYRLPGTAKSFIAGAVAGTAATTVTYPLDLLRTRFAAQGKEKVYDGLLASIRDITRHEGPKGFYRGLSAGIAQIVPYMGLFFALYESFKPLFANVQLPFESLGSGEAVAGVAASVLSKTAVFPLDTIRKRLQVQGPTRAKFGGGKIPTYTGVSGTLKAILKREGVRGLYRGLSVGLLKAAPASAVTIWTYERVMGALKALDEKI